MSRFGGMGNFGGLGDIQKLAKQAQKMQEDAAKLQEELASMRVTGQAGGGMVTATVNGHGHLVELKINPVVADPEDVEMLEDLIASACNAALKKVRRAVNEETQKMASGLGLPGGMGLPGLE